MLFFNSFLLNFEAGNELCPPLFPSPQPPFSPLSSLPPSMPSMLCVFFFCCRYLLSFITLTSISHCAFLFYYISCYAMLSYLFHHISFIIPQLILSCLILSYLVLSYFFLFCFFLFYSSFFFFFFLYLGLLWATNVLSCVTLLLPYSATESAYVRIQTLHSLS